jgi:hypothetical protein
LSCWETVSSLFCTSQSSLIKSDAFSPIIIYTSNK